MGCRVTYSYDPDGNRQTRIDARGNLTTYVYDSRNLLITRQYPDGTRATFTYNALGDRTMMANQTGRYTTTYDDLRRKQTVVTPVGKTITYSYDAISRKAGMEVGNAGRFTYLYDANNQLVGLQNPQNDRTSFSYDAAGRRILKELANGTRATYLYDPAGNMTRIANLKSTGETISQFDYTYDPVGNKIQIATVNGSRTTYSYDATYRLTEEHRTGPNAYQNTYNYDPTGNRILTVKDGARTTSTFDPANQNVYSLDANGRTTYTFDQSGNRTGVEKPDGSRTTTTYDYENRDIRVQLPSGIVNTMQYDPDGLRVLLQDSTGTTKFLYDNQQYLLQTNGSNVIVAVQSQEPGVYSNLISQYQFDSTLWVPNYYHYDSLGNTTELTGSTQIVTDTYDYNAWGEFLARTGTTLNPFQYRGRYGYFLVTDTGEVYVLMRTYDPMTGRWTTLDILRFVDGLNMYVAYFVPNGVDLSGLLTPTIFWDEWTPMQRGIWFLGFLNKYKMLIKKSAEAHCVPYELLASVIANEMIDYSGTERFGESWGFGNSLGPAQLTIPVAKDYGLFPGLSDSEIRSKLINESTNIDAAGTLMKKYLEILCATMFKNSAYGGPILPKDVLVDVASIVSLQKQRAFLQEVCCPRSCSSRVNQDVSAELIALMSAMFNDSPTVLTASNPNVAQHAQNALNLNGIFSLMPGISK